MVRFFSHAPLRAFTLIVALGIAVPSLAAPPVASATITMTSYRFTPGPIYLAGGVPVRLILVNGSGKKHDFSAPEFFRSSRILGGRVAGGGVSLDGGRSQVIDLVPARGTYKVHCSKFGHSMLGMTTTIIVG